VRHIASKNWMILSLKAQRSLYIPPMVTIYTASGHYIYRLGHYTTSGHYMYRLGHYVPPVVTICTASDHYMYRQWSPYVPPVAIICTASGHYMYRQWSLYVPPVVTICTADGHYMYHQLNIPQFHVLATQCIYVFCVDLRTNSDYFPIRHNWMVCITETELPVSLHNTSLHSTSSVLTQYSHSVFSRIILT
jgi:hypothetical protein